MMQELISWWIFMNKKQVRFLINLSI
jgi:hypothetical protein